MSVHVRVWDDEVETEAEGERVTVPEGDYFIIVTEPATESLVAYANGTHVITVKGRKLVEAPRSGPPRVVPG